MESERRRLMEIGSETLSRWFDDLDSAHRAITDAMTGETRDFVTHQLDRVRRSVREKWLEAIRSEAK
jgi:hypothetical protein